MLPQRLWAAKALKFIFNHNKKEIDKEHSSDINAKEA